MGYMHRCSKPCFHNNDFKFYRNWSYYSHNTIKRPNYGYESKSLFKWNDFAEVRTNNKLLVLYRFSFLCKLSYFVNEFSELLSQITVQP
jgi:hypothetical protein